jgi:hypothetical protein
LRGWQRSTSESEPGMTGADLTSAVWRKSTRSGTNTDCVEIAELATGCAVRDSKDPHGPVLHFDRAAWTAFVTAVQAAEIDAGRSDRVDG